MPCSITAQIGMVANFKVVGFRKNEGHGRKQCPVSAFSCGSCTARPVAASRVYHNLIRRRMSVVSMASKSGKNKHSDTPAYKELYEAFPEAILWKKSSKAANKKSQVPDFANEEELLKSLELRFESDMDVERTRHYEIMYLIHEDNANEVQEVVSMVKDFVEERKGKIWRINDWGMRRLAYKIKKATKANYILMNFEFGAEHINELKNALDKDERVIRHLVIKRDAAISEDYPPPPAFRSISDEDYMDEYDDQVEGELDEEWEEVVEGDEEGMDGAEEYGDLVEGKIEEELKEEIEGDVEDTEGADGYDDQVEGELEEDWEEDGEELESTEQEDVKQLVRQ